MTNYKQFYNSWQSFAKPKRQLLLEVATIPAKISVNDFLNLTTRPDDLQIIKKNIADEPRGGEGESSITVEVDDYGNAKVVGHDGRHRALNFKLKAMKKRGIGLMQKLPELVAKEVLSKGGKQEDIEKEINHILFFGHPDKFQINIEPVKSLISWTEKESEKEKLDINVIVSNKEEGFNLADIKQFIGQFNKQFVLSKSQVLTGELKTVNLSDPINIGDAGITIKGYAVRIGNDLMGGGIKNFLIKQFSKYYSLQKNGYTGYAKILNDAYDITDQNGNKYKVALSPSQKDWYDRNDPNPALAKKDYTVKGSNSLNLEPPPYENYGDNLEAKEKVNSEILFTIKKK